MEIHNMLQMSGALDTLASETGWLRRLARSLVHDATEAEDLVHDAFIIAAERPSAAPLRPWVVRVMTNLSRMRLRAAARRSVRERAVAELADAPALPAELVERLELHRLLAGLVLRLTPASRDVVLLIYFEGMSSSAAGRKLGVPASTVRWRLKQALCELREALDDKKPRKAWMAALAGFGWPRKATTGLPWLAAAAIAIIVAAGWLVRELHAPEGQAARATIGHRRESAVAQLLAEPTALHQDITLRAAGLELSALEQAMVIGHVFDEHGAPIADVQVDMACQVDDPGDDPDAGKSSTRSRGDGLFVFVRPLGCWPNIVAHKGELGGVGESGEDRDHFFQVVLRPTRSVPIQVVDDQTSAPIADARVEVEQFMLAMDTARTDRNGLAWIRWIDMAWADDNQLDRIHASFAAEHPGYSPSATWVDHRSALAQNVVIRLGRGIRVRGQVRGPNDQPVAHARVSFAGTPRSGLMRAQAPRAVSADEAGRFELHLARAAQYALYAGTLDMMSTRADEAQLTVSTSGREDVIIHVEPRANVGVDGVVIDASGAPVAGATVTAVGSAFAPVTTDARGAFAFRVAAARLLLITRAGALASDYTPVEVVRGKATHVTLRAEPAGITGVVVDGDGHSIAHAQVWLNQVERGGRVMISGQRFFTDDNGAFSIDVPRGNFRLSVRRSFDDDFLDEDDTWVAGGSRDVKLVLP